MKLYKYIDFKNSYWSEPLIKKELYFSNVCELRQPNDPEEFNHKWDSKSYFFNNQANQLKETYQSIFSDARILCLSKLHSKTLWDEFCSSNNGICYEFKYEESQKIKDLTACSVSYSDNKECNYPDYLIKSIEDTNIKNLLEKNIELSKTDLVVIYNWLTTKDAQNLAVNHIYYLVFTKLKCFIKENEYRFIHTVNPIDNNTPLLINSRFSFKQLGLTINRIYTSNYNKVKEVCNESQLKISIPSFITCDEN